MAESGNRRSRLRTRSGGGSRTSSAPPEPPEPPAESDGYFSPYGWAVRVITHLNGRGELAEFPLKVDLVRDAVVALSDVTRIAYRGMTAPKPRKLIGRFTRTHVTDPANPIHAPIVEVLIDYDETLDEPTRRLVICKEICHALYSGDQTTRTATREDLQALMEGLAAMNAPRRSSEVRTALSPYSQPLQAEQLAMVTAIEILCPFDLRTLIIDQHGGIENVPAADYVRDFLLPGYILEQLFTRGFHDNAKLYFSRFRGI